jgi:hypothetical protein
MAKNKTKQTENFEQRIPHLEIPSYDNKNTEIEGWLKFFNKKCEAKQLKNDWKVENVSNYLSGDVFNYYIEQLLDFESWEEIEDGLITQFSSVDSNLFNRFLNLKLNDDKNLESYFNEKSKLARKLKLNEPLLIESLNHGSPSYLKKHLIAAQVDKPRQWIQIASKLLAANEPIQVNRAQTLRFPSRNTQERGIPPQRFSPPVWKTTNAAPQQEYVHRPRFTPTYSSPRVEYQSTRGPSTSHNNIGANDLPPTACRICEKMGLLSQWHWHNQCPRSQIPIQSDVLPSAPSEGAHISNF